MSGSPIAPINLTEAQILQRVSRFSELKEMPSQSSGEFPQDVADIVWARRLLPVIGLEGEGRTAFGKSAPIEGAAGMTMIVAACPPGTGPSLHVHRRTYETFTVLRGTFEFDLLEDRRHKVRLGAFDTISIPPRVYRCFTNVGDEEGLLQVLISGGVNDMEDVAFSRSVATEIEGYGSRYVSAFEKLGYRFDEPAASAGSR